METIPIFDSLTHPTINGKWLHLRYRDQNTIQNLLSDMKQNEVKWALAVGLGKEVGDYSDETYSKFIHEHSEILFPIAFLNLQDFESVKELENHLKYLKKLNYTGIKIHPRLSKISYNHHLLIDAINIANEMELITLLCTYFHWALADNTFCDLNSLANLLSKIPDKKIILVHVGTVELLRLSEAVKPFPNVLVDLSMTLCKYEGSSLDLDLQFLFKTFDQRICIGSDSPEFSGSDLRKRFSYFSQNISKEKAENIAYKNLAKIFNLETIHSSKHKEGALR